MFIPTFSFLENLQVKSTQYLFNCPRPTAEYRRLRVSVWERKWVVRVRISIHPQTHKDTRTHTHKTENSIRIWTAGMEYKGLYILGKYLKFLLCAI